MGLNCSLLLHADICAAASPSPSKPPPDFPFEALMEFSPANCPPPVRPGAEEVGKALNPPFPSHRRPKRANTQPAASAQVGVRSSHCRKLGGCSYLQPHPGVQGRIHTSNKPLLLHSWSVIEFLGRGMKMHVEKSPLCCREELSREVSLKYHHEGYCNSLSIISDASGKRPQRVGNE